MLLTDDYILAKMNDFLVKTSHSCTKDLLLAVRFINEIKDEKFSDDQQLNEQFKACAVLLSVLMWASLHSEDFSDFITWWNKELGPEVLNEYRESCNGKP